MNNKKQNSAEWNAVEVEWKDGSYHSGGKPPKKPENKNLRNMIIACLCTCVVSVGASVGGMAALAGAGVFSSAPAVSASAETASSSGAIQQSTTQQVSAASEDTSTLQGATAKAMQSIVLIQGYSKSGGMSYGSYHGFDFGFGDAGTERLSGEGSGVIATADGYIITNAHVVADISSLKVTTQDGTVYDAKVIGSDDVSDLAVIKIDANGLQAAEFGQSADLQVGDRVIAVGNPGGSSFSSSATYGFVSATDREVTTSDEYKMTCIQVDAAINPGNSGGALVNQQGQVIGITSSKIVSTEYEGLGFAIPIDTALPIINDLRENGYVSNRAILGIRGQYIDNLAAMYYNMECGYYVAFVDSDEAEASGLQKGDIIQKIDDTEITSSGALTSYLATKAPGDTAKLTVSRDGKEKTLSIVLSKYTQDDQ